MNRVKAAIEKYRQHIKEKAIPQAKLDKLALADSMLELGQFQNIQAQAFASGRLNEEEAALLYQILGREVPTPAQFNARPVEERIVAMKTIAELSRRA